MKSSRNPVGYCPLSTKHYLPGFIKLSKSPNFDTHITSYTIPRGFGIATNPYIIYLAKVIKELTTWLLKIVIVPFVVLAHIISWFDRVLFDSITNFPSRNILNNYKNGNHFKSIAWLIFQVGFILLWSWILLSVLDSA